MPTPGNKTLRIFRKDLSHLWPEIALTLALTLGFALTEHFLWPRYFSISGADVYRTLALWMNALLPVAWWVLIARAVHDESLVGHLQFWVTRPYGWQRLLAAKLLLIAAFILAPFLLTHHLHPLSPRRPPPPHRPPPAHRPPALHRQALRGLRPQRIAAHPTPIQ